MPSTTRRRPSRLAGALVGYAAGCLAAVAGVGIEWGAGPALIAGGVVCAASCALLVEVDDQDDARRRGAR